MARNAPPQYESNGTAAESAEALESRVRRLEHAVAALQDTQLMEDRVVERVARRPITTATRAGATRWRVRPP